MHRRRFLRHAWSLVLGTLVAWRGPWPDPAKAGKGKTSGRERAVPRLAVIIDDIGYSYRRAEAFLHLKLPLTYSILPQLPKSPRLARTIRDRGHEIMLHQPMEPFDRRLDPGPGALFVDDPVKRIVRTLEGNLVTNLYAVGVNNHMGSRFTSCSGKIASALEVVKSRGLYFVDSVTSRRSVAHQTACQMGISAGYNRFFLDSELREPLIYHRLFQLENAALQHGYAIGIGHPHAATARALGRFARTHGSDPLRWVYVSEIFKPSSSGRTPGPKPNSGWFFKHAI